jgi:hypothetical protein
MKRLALLTASALIAASPLALAQTTSKSHDTGSAASAQASASVTTETQVKQKIEAAGYNNVTGIKKDHDGWRAEASKNGKQVALDVDRSGKVTPAALSGSSTARGTPGTTDQGTATDMTGRAGVAPGTDTSHGGTTTQSLGVAPPGAGTTGR